MRVCFLTKIFRSVVCCDREKTERECESRWDVGEIIEGGDGYGITQTDARDNSLVSHVDDDKLLVSFSWESAPSLLAGGLLA